MRIIQLMKFLPSKHINISTIKDIDSYRYTNTLQTIHLSNNGSEMEQTPREGIMLSFVWECVSASNILFTSEGRMEGRLTGRSVQHLQ